MQENNEKSTGVSGGAAIERTFEIFFGITAKIGAEKQVIIQRLTDVLVSYGYQVELIKVTSIIKMLEKERTNVVGPSICAAYQEMIQLCNNIRNEYVDSSVLSRLAITRISQSRKRITGSTSPFHNKKIAYIVDQLKLPKEIEFMRLIYGPRYFQIGITAKYKQRLDSITNREASALRRRPEDVQLTAAQLLKQDDAEEGNQFGQDVREAFASSDFFVDSSSNEETERFLHAIFGGNSISPNSNEVGMSIAAISALRSADLSRQVGAALYSEDNEIISTGCNEVPRPFGGQYWQEDLNDQRDFILGFDQNAKIKDQIREQIVNGIMAKLGMASTATKADVYEELFSSPNAPLKDSMLSDLTEFGRAVHAEMAAILEAGRRGISTKGATLYCTTFPCHNCAKHIVASGIRRVVYIEPYPKSRALDLHSDALVCEAISPDFSEDKVQFQEFLGIGPSRFNLLFKRKKRKDNVGDFENVSKLQSYPIGMPPLPTYEMDELAAIKLLKKEG